MIPEPQRDNMLIVIIALLAIAIIAVGVMIYTAPAEEEEEKKDSAWITEERSVLSPNATAKIVYPEGCLDCTSSLTLLENLQSDWANLGTNIVDVQTVSDTSEEGRNLVIRYNIEKLPALVLRKDGQWDSRILSAWFGGIGSVEDDSSLVQREVVPPYYDTVSDSVRGKVEFIYLTDSTCEECYNASEFAADLVSVFEMSVMETAEYDVASVEGNAIVSQYGITAVPTFLVSEEASVYSGFEDFWLAKDNTKEEDGWYVFRDVKYLGVEYVTLNASESG